MKTIQEVYEGIKTYTHNINMGKYSLCINEMNAIKDCSPSVYDMIYLSFKFGFEKGCRKTKKAVKA